MITADDLPILIVEDNRADYETIIRVFQKTGVKNPVHHCETGQQTLDFLRHNDVSDPENHKPGLILLDLNLPGMDGRTVLKQIKNDNELKSIPVVVFTTSESEKDISECYASGANSYITKPVDIDRFCDVIKALKTYWFETVYLPEEKTGH